MLGVKIFLKLFRKKLYIFFDFILPKHNNIIIINDSSLGDNTEIFFEYILRDDFYRIFWLWTNKDMSINLKKKYPNNSIIKLNSIRGLFYFSIAKIAIIGHGYWDFLNYFNIRSAKYILNLWHGIPVKIKNNNLKNSKINYKKMVMVTNNDNEIKYFKKWNMIKENNIKKWGSPRFEYIYKILSNVQNYQNLKIKIKNKLNIDLDSKILLYAPTYREKSTTKIFPFPDINFNIISEICEKFNILLIIKKHPNDNNKFSQDIKNKIENSQYIQYFVENKNIDRLELIIVSDALITDYSSIVYDFLLMNKPIAFIPYDIDQYQINTSLTNEYYQMLSMNSKVTFDDFKDWLIEIGKNDYGLSRNIDKTDILKKYFQFENFDINNRIKNGINLLLTNK